jgi:hypothetical protein
MCLSIKQHFMKDLKTVHELSRVGMQTDRHVVQLPDVLLQHFVANARETQAGRGKT